MVTVSIRAYSTSTVAASGDFFTIPTGYRPPSTVYALGYMNIMTASGSTTLKDVVPLLVAINNTGTVNFGYSSTQYANQCGFYASYFV